ncbi:aldehyde dehydrogenase family-domain-containing protein [Suillus bovinus]|uniref:aldehyde dehydrogenase family-domain-containing protein n=1 Tax=Suillus bovinus TaxID=48563 RepID=UPI001B8869FA|nr:aldehyde dehydrogenase family-domain-containing protein [Suillus bovinus]KAG2129662.1 aldehyde dehydrogenase family-domain-containing protein [Suillus bovinus]
MGLARRRLAAPVFTKDIDRAIRVVHALEAGTAWINCANQTEISMPFGGFKQSGIGRELSEYALENYTNVKAVRVNIQDAHDAIRKHGLRQLFCFRYCMPVECC